MLKRKLKVKITDHHLKEEEILELIEDQKLKEVLLFRLKVIKFHEKHGTKLTIDTLKISKATIYRWKKLWK